MVALIDRQSRAVSALSALAEMWLKSRSSPNELLEPYPNDMVWLSLSTLLESFEVQSLWSLIDNEQVRGASGPPIIGHIIASNTPLLPIVSVVRALLVGSDSIVKLPSRIANGWFTLFLSQLTDVDSTVASHVETGSWQRSEQARNHAFYERANLIIAYGNNESLSAIRMSSQTPVLGYGHRISAAIITNGEIQDSDFDGLAADILMYDQSGCLSPHTVFVEGELYNARSAAKRLVEALSKCQLSAVRNSPDRAARVEQARTLISMDHSAEIIGSDGARFTVVVHEAARLHVSAGHSIIYVVPAVKEGIIEVIMRAQPLIQGIALAFEESPTWDYWKQLLVSAGFNHICRTGTLQRPTIHWREDSREVLGSLIL